MVPRPEASCADVSVVQKPCFHVQPPQGWLNDPNGPIFYEGMYHMFYQWYPRGCAWSWGLYWGHAISKDMVTWTHLPPALAPTQGGPDQDGCWSGCAVRDVDGTATILYTAVRLRNSEDKQHELDLNLPMIESQCLATADAGDPKLLTWTKATAPIIPLPPHKNLGGFRDPFVLGRPGDAGEGEWTIMVGSGVKGEGGAEDSIGTALVYKSPSLQSGWRYEGELCRGIGKMWECPVMATLPLWNTHPAGAAGGVVGEGEGEARGAAAAAEDMACTPTGAAAPRLPLEEREDFMEEEEREQGLPAGSSTRLQQAWQQHRHMLAVCPDDCSNPIHYYLGSYKGGRFDVDTAIGPLVLDHGDILYAPQILVDHPEDHAVLFGWLQERRPTGTYSYAGCLSMPRLLWLEVEDETGTSEASSNGTSANGTCEHGTSANGTSAGATITDGGSVNGTSEKDPSGNGTSLASSFGASVNGVAGGTGESKPSRGSRGVGGPAVHLRQQPLPGVKQLRHKQRRWESSQVMSVTRDAPFTIPQVHGLHLETVLSLSGSPGTLSAVALHMGEGPQGTPLLVFDWSTGKLEVYHRPTPAGPLPPTLTTIPEGWQRVAGGVLKRRPAAGGQPLGLQIFVDYSVLEVFTDKGEALTTRLHPPSTPNPHAAVELLSLAGCTRVHSAAAYELQPIWKADAPLDWPMPDPAPRPNHN